MSSTKHSCRSGLRNSLESVASSNVRFQSAMELGACHANEGCGTHWNPLCWPTSFLGGTHTHTHTHGRGTLWNPLRRPILALQSPQNSLCCSLGHCCHNVVIPQTRLTLPQQTLWAAQQELPTFGTMVPWLPRRRKTPKVHPAPTNPLGCPTGNCTL